MKIFLKYNVNPPVTVERVSYVSDEFTRIINMSLF